MAKIGNETKLIIRLLKEKAKHFEALKIDKVSTTKTGFTWRDSFLAQAYEVGFIDGVERMLNTIELIIMELER